MASDFTEQKIIVRAFDDEPILLYATATEGMRVIVRGRDHERQVSLPQFLVYNFDESHYLALAAAYKRGDQETLKALWGQTTLFPVQAITSTGL